MKKVLLIVIMLVSVVFANAQNYLVEQIQNVSNGDHHYCTSEYAGIVLYAHNCESYEWTVSYGDGTYEHYYNLDSIVISNIHPYTTVNYLGCGLSRGLTIYFHGSELASPFLEPLIWKSQYDSIRLSIPIEYDDEYQWEWFNGSTDFGVYVTDDGIYNITFTSRYGCELEESTFSIEVRDNVELYRATVDLETNLNKATWQVTEQSEYISEVKVYRDGLLVGTAPYGQGYYLDAIGSDNAARNYQIVGVGIEGEDCPISSYQKGTIHTTYYQDVNNNLNMTWNIPYVEEGAQGALTYFQICKYDPNTGELTVVDQVNSSITDYTCGVNQFDGGYAVIAAVFSNGKNMEELSFSNLTTEILGVDEKEPTCFRVYPNPAKDRITIEGNGIMTITNALGQIIMTKGIDGKETFELPQGIYFVKLNGTTRKVVVE